MIDIASHESILVVDIPAVGFKAGNLVGFSFMGAIFLLGMQIAVVSCLSVCLVLLERRIICHLEIFRRIDVKANLFEWDR